MGSYIPSPSELRNEVSASVQLEADTIVNSIVSQLRSNVHGIAFATGTEEALEVAKLLLKNKGWRCEVSTGNHQDRKPVLRVWAP